MRNDSLRKHRSHLRLGGVCDEHLDVFAANEGGKNTVGTLGTNVGVVTGLLADQSRHFGESRTASANCRLYRRLIYVAMRAIVKVARLLGLKDPAMLDIPYPSAIGDEKLLSSAQGLVDRVTPHAAAFLSAGMPSDLLANLVTRIQGLAASKAALATARQQYAAVATAVLEKQAETDAAVNALQAIAETGPGSSAAVLTEFRIARRIGPRVPDKADEPAAAPATASTVPAAAKTA